MLAAGYADEPLLPQNDLVYVAFRLGYFDLMTELDTDAALGTADFDDGPYGFLTNVPFFRTVPPTVQLDLLASVWAKHHSPQVQPALLLDAAVLWAIFNDAGRIGLEVWEGALSPVLNDGPCKVTVTMDESLDERWKEMFDDFWDDVDFLSLDDMQDMPPEQAKALREQFDIPEVWVDDMFAVLNRARASAAILDNLRGLLSEQEIADHRSRLLPE